MTNKKKMIAEKIENMNNSELLEFSQKFRKERNYIVKEDVDFIQDAIDSQELLLRKQAGIS